MNAQKYVIGNWKLNPSTHTHAQQLAAAMADLQSDASVTVGCTPSFVHLSAVAAAMADTPILVGAQDVCAYTQDVGAYTGDVSALQLVDVGADFVIVGHSERRSYYGEDNALLADKIKQALAADLTVIFCVGETQTQYTAKQTLAVLDEQLSALAGIAATDKLIVAYEPVWAIGTGLTPTVDEVTAVHQHIKARLNTDGWQGISVLYGGSVNANNADEFAHAAAVDGALVGGASLKIDAFAQIVAAFAKAQEAQKI
ncbi:triose-phosphate isomerase [Moraxella sp. ZJ142]|uniref:triose-phosphate isomerase n=1 Tax=Moraxella marmotae TaxID=3344520 RepID=UPI0035D4B1DC